MVALFAGTFYVAEQAKNANNEGIEILTQVKGNPDASITLTEYSDFQCPACAQAAPIIAEIVEQFSDDIRFEYKHFPLESIHPYAMQAAMAAEAAGQQGAFFAYHDLLFENQADWGVSPTPNVFFLQYAEELELDMDQFRRQSDASVLRDKARDEFAEGRESGVTGTPEFVLNGELLRNEQGGNPSYAEITARITAAVTGEVVDDAAPADVVEGVEVEFGV